MIMITVPLLVFALFVLSYAIQTPEQAIVIATTVVIGMMVDIKREDFVATLLVTLGLVIVLLTPFFGVPVYYIILGMAIALIGLFRSNKTNVLKGIWKSSVHKS